MITKRFFTWSAAAILFTGVCTSLSAQSKAPWLHLEVKENHAQQETVKVNLPFSMVEVALDLLKDKKFDHGHFRMHTHGDITLADIKKLWSELKKAGEAEFVSVEKGDETVRVARSGDFLLVKVTESKKKQSKVDLKIHFSVVDALLSGPGEELDLRAAVQSLRQTSQGDILTVHDGDTEVKLWIE